MLNDYYDNKRTLITHHLDMIFRVPTMNSETLSSLQEFVNIFRENIAAIRAFEITDLAGFLLFYIASRVLSTTMKHLFEAENQSVDVPSIDSLLKFVQTKCQIIKNTSGPSVQKPMINRKFGQSKSSLVISSLN